MIQKRIWLIHSMHRHKKIILHRSVSVLFFLSFSVFDFLKYHNHNSVPLLIQACFCFDLIILCWKKPLQFHVISCIRKKACWLGVKMSIRFSSSHLILFVCLFVCLLFLRQIFCLFVFLKKVGLF